MILDAAKEKFFHKLQKENLLHKRISLRAKVLSTEEAIGNPEEYDFPLLKGREKIIEAEFEGHKGHAFTDMYGGYEGSLKDVLDLPLSNNYRRALLVATINALMSYWGLVKDTVHCKNEQPRECAKKSLRFLQEQYPLVNRIALVGYQPALIDALSKKYVLKILDLDKENIGTERFGCPVLDGGEYLRDAAEWSDLVLATGSTVVNGTIDDIVQAAVQKPVVFYGVTIAGVAGLLDLKRMCFVGEI